MVELNYDYSSVKVEDLKKYEEQVKKIVCDIENGTCLGNDYLGWKNYLVDVDGKLIKDIIDTAKKIRQQCETFVVCGIGGSYLGARAVIEAIKGFIKKDIEIIYIGNTFDERYTRDVIEYLKNKNFSINVISKSGTTLETALAFRLLKKELERKYGENSKERIFVTTDSNSGCLREISTEECYKTFSIPKDVGGRYSVFTPVGLLPLAVAGVDIEKFISGACCAISDLKKTSVEKNIAYQYSIYRYLKYQSGKSVELFATYSPYLTMLGEWWKQLFGESEGKEGKGLFPASVTFSTDLHSLGQFVQEGSKILFITQIMLNDSGNLRIDSDDKNMDNLNYINKFTFDKINKIAQTATNIAHYNIGEVDNFTFVLDQIDEFNVGYLLYVMMYSCAISAGLLNVNAFDQPGVEYYKAEMKKILKK